MPSIPWSGSFGNPGDDGPLQANLQEDGTIPRETFEAGCVHSAEEALAAAERVQYPVMLKASEGGGGKGIRMCKNAEELSAAFPQVENEQPGSERRPFITSRVDASAATTSRHTSMTQVLRSSSCSS